ncbi:MAG: hypothetical protein MJ222_01770 [Bacilli bacterium]|nr:hypothetical protein [Bacilli bacterium]
MKFKKANALFLVSCSLLAGCNNEPKTALLSNAQFVLYNSCDEALLFHAPSLEEFTNLYNSNLNYIILFSEDDCSACKYFNPIIKKYVEETHQLVIKVGGENRYKIEQEYKDRFFPNSGVLTPALFVKENGDNIYKVDYDQYMGTYGVFKRHMNSKFKTSKCAYFTAEIPGKSRIISNYTYVSFQSNETFKNKLSDKLMNTEKNVLISPDFTNNFMTVYEKNLNGDFDVVRTTPINDELDDETIEKYL